MTFPYYQTTAHTKTGHYLFHLAEWRELDKSIATAKEWHARPISLRKGYYAIIRNPEGKLVFDSRLD